MSGKKLVLLVYFGIFTIPFLISVIMLINRIVMVRTWEKTTGYVIRNIQSSETYKGYTTDNMGNRKYTESTSWYYYPEINFTTKEGERRKFFGKRGTTDPAFEVEEQVPVYYKPQSPDNARIGKFFYVWGWPIGFGGPVLLLMLIFGSAIIYIGSRGAFDMGSTSPEARERRIARYGFDSVQVETEVNDIIDTFILASEELNYSVARDLMGEEALAGMPEEKFIAYNKNITEAIGTYVSRSKTYSKIGPGENGGVDCSFNYNFTYTNGTLITGFRLKKRGDRLKITGYNLDIKK